jgi:hypothetical protein
MATINAYSKGIRNDFANKLAAKNPTGWDKFIAKTASQLNSEDFWIAGTAPAISELLDRVNLSTVQDFKYTITNKDFYAGIRERTNTIKDSEKYLGGAVTMQIRSMVDQYASFDAMQIYQLLVNSTSATAGLAFDGTTFFNTTRPFLDTGSNTINNIYSASSSEVAGFNADFQGAVGRMMGFKDRDNRPFHTEYGNFTVLVDPADYMRAIRTLDVKYAVPNSTLPVFTGMADVVVNPFSTSAGTWYLIKNSGDAFITVDREAPKWYESSEEEASKGIYTEFWMRFRKGFGYGNPVSIVRVA